jgi:hypothetical protein
MHRAKPLSVTHVLARSCGSTAARRARIERCERGERSTSSFGSAACGAVAHVRVSIEERGLRRRSFELVTRFTHFTRASGETAQRMAAWTVQFDGRQRMPGAARKRVTRDEA